ncbi:MAG: hypothetical protein IPM69_11075 [Ignavibacteria bacterium]|nr:hypothetical protein [Ignavibacteria bacterium]
MKSYIILVLTIIGLIAPQFALLSQQIPERRLTWIPGFNERNTFWQRYFTRFPATHHIRQDQSVNSDHQSNMNLTNLSTTVGAPLNGYNNEPLLAQPIGIGHSMGGLLSRDIDRQWTGQARKFCAIITVGTPNSGAFAVNAVQSGMVEQAFMRATRAVALGPAYDVTSGAADLLFTGNFAAGLVSGVTSIIGGQEVIDYIGKTIWNDNLHGFIQNVNTAPASEMAVGNARMSQFGAPNVPTISIWGNEDGPMIYRMATVASRRNDIPNDPMDFSTDTKYVDWANSAASVYHAAAYAHGVYSMVSGLWGIITLNPAGVAAAAYHAVAADAYSTGRSYIKWDAENDYRRIIGATWVETIKTLPDYRVYNFRTKTWTKLPRLDDIEEPDMKESREMWNMDSYTLVYRTHNDAADAFIPVTSQNAIPLLTASYQAIGAGHLEQGNHVEVRRRFEDIFTRQNNLEYFTPKRQ